MNVFRLSIRHNSNIFKHKLTLFTLPFFIQSTATRSQNWSGICSKATTRIFGPWFIQRTRWRFRSSWPSLTSSPWWVLTSCQSIFFCPRPALTLTQPLHFSYRMKKRRPLRPMCGLRLWVFSFYSHTSVLFVQIWQVSWCLHVTVDLYLSLKPHLQQWTDYRLSWNQSEYYDISIIRVPCKTVWLPDIVLENKYEG